MINSKITSLEELKEHLKYKSDTLDTWLKLHNFMDLKWIDVFTELLSSVNRPHLNWWSIYKWFVQNPNQRGSLVDEEQRWLMLGKDLVPAEQKIWWKLVIQELKNTTISPHEKERLFEKFIKEALEHNMEITFLEKFYTQLPELTHVYAYYFYIHGHKDHLEKLIRQPVYDVNYSHLKRIQQIARYWSNANFILTKNCSAEIKNWYMEQFKVASTTDQFFTRPPDIKLVNRLDFITDDEYRTLAIYLKNKYIDLSDISDPMLKWMSNSECSLSLKERASIYNNTFNYWTLRNIEMFHGLDKAKLIQTFINTIYPELDLEERIHHASSYDLYANNLNFLEQMYPDIKNKHVQTFAFMFPEMDVLFKNFDNTMSIFEIEDTDILIEQLTSSIRLFNIKEVELPFIEF